MLQLQNTRHHHSGRQHLLILNKLLRSDRVPPETSSNQKQQRDPEQKPAFPFKTRFANQFFQRSVGNHTFAPAIRFWSSLIVPGIPISCNSISEMFVEYRCIARFCRSSPLWQQVTRESATPASAIYRSDLASNSPTLQNSPAESFSLGTQRTPTGQFSADMPVIQVVLPSASARGCLLHDSLAFHSE